MKTQLESPDLYTIGWITALPIELAAATALLDEYHVAPEGFEQRPSDTNSYTWGRIGEHNVVIASLPAGVYGITSAATTASNLIHSLHHIRIGLLVGIGGGIARPHLDHDIRLGDVVVSQPDGTTGGVVQYDFGKAKANGAWERKGSLDKPPLVLLSALGRLQAEHEQAPSKVPELLQKMLEANPYMKRPKKAFTYPGAENDRLFESQHDHVGGSNCDKCDSAWEVKRDRRESTDPEIHYGVIASGNTLIKDAATRDSLLEDTGHQCLCVEMEAAGLMDRFPCLVIRGICDYADSHKNDRWQRYAAATAAAFAVELLEYVPVGQLEATQKVVEAIQSLNMEMCNLRTSIDNIVHRITLEGLPNAKGASFDSHAEEHSPTCLPGTRVGLLKDINRWVDDQNSKTIFWLNGMAGTGKSTIARTIAQMQHKRGNLGASFFFKRGETDRGSLAKFVPTVARRLAWNMPEVAPFIKNAIDADPAIADKTVREQFEKLIREPLSKAAATPSASTSVVMVIDALDECGREADIRLLINILSQAQTFRPHLRISLTSRPELPIRLGFSEVEGTYQNLVLHEMPTQIVEHDISTFLVDEFRKIRDDFNRIVGDERKLPSDWPGQQALQDLTHMAVPLFIFAATVCRFIGDRKCGSPLIQLRKVLDYRSKSHGSQLDLTYGPVLRSQVTDVSGDDREEIIKDFSLIVGSIVILASPLSVSALSQLLEISPDVVDSRLDTLHSVLSVPRTREAPVRLLHLSFRDYLVDPNRKQINEFWVDEKSIHRALARNCLRVMRSALRKNICELSFPGMRRSEIDGLSLEKWLAPEVQYACLYWVHHLTDIQYGADDSLHVYSFLVNHFLYWLEAMSLMGRTRESLRILQSLKGLVKEEECPKLSNFINDAVRFVRINFSIIDEAPLQVYASALIFAPRKSIIRKSHENQIPSWLLVRPYVEEDWDSCLSVLEGHNNLVDSAVFSHDSTMVASSSYDKTVRIWNTQSGECKHILEGHGDRVCSVVFSHDSTMVASASYDKTVRIWNTQNGECKHILKGHSSLVHSAVFSHDSTMVASASHDKTVRIWNTQNGECKRVLEGYSSVRSVVFSHDSTMVASASWDKTTRIWNTQSGECKHILEGHSGWVNSVVFSHGSTMVASASWDRTVRIWNTQNGECKHILESHGGRVRSVVFSHDSTMVALASYGMTVRTWNAQSGECKQKLKGHSSAVNSVVFSHDSTMVASGSGDNTVRIWNMQNGECEEVLKGHDDAAYSVVFSHDSTMVASASHDKTVRIWNTQNGECKHILKGHSSLVHSAVFSHDSTMVASASHDKTVRIWNTQNGECKRVLEGHSSGAYSVVFSHDSTMVASGSDDNTVRIWNMQNGECKHMLKGHSNLAHSAVFSHDSTMVASASWDRTVRIWNTQNGECKHILKGHSSIVFSAVFSHDSTMVASASWDRTVRIWDTQNGECKHILKGHCSIVFSTVFSHDSTMVALASYDNTVRIWNMESGKCQEVVSGKSYTKVLSLTAHNPGLVTSTGIVFVTGQPVSSAEIATRSQSATASLLGLRGDTWITMGENDLLWLPAECRGGKIAISGNSVVVGCRSGRVILLGFSISEIAKL